MNKDLFRTYEFTFDFMATRFSGLSHQDEPRSESLTLRAHSFAEAIEQLRQKLHDFRGSNSFYQFTVKTPRGTFIVSIEPDPLTDIHGVLNHASFTLGEQLTEVR